MLCEQLLNFRIVHKFLLSDAQDLKGSLLRNEAAADSEPPLRDSLAANVRIFLAKDSVVLLLEVCFDLVVPL